MRRCHERSKPIAITTSEASEMYVHASSMGERSAALQKICASDENLPILDLQFAHLHADEARGGGDGIGHHHALPSRVDRNRRAGGRGWIFGEGITR